MKTFSLNISCLCLHGKYLIYVIYLLNGLIRMSTDCSVDLIPIPLAAELYYFEFKNIYMANYFYFDSDK